MMGCETMYLLSSIRGHADLVKLNDAQRSQLCDEIREFIVSHVAKTGGHLASNLGVVELTVAIETVFNTAQDRLVFDVGHQSYIHKLLTGRQADFERLRMFGGMSGFPKPHESETDAFVAGHASSSVSIALGMARARKLTGEDYKVVALLGDGAATGGMVYEALNDAGASREPMVVILNDNEMSIDRNVGGMAAHLSNLRTKEGYFSFKKSYRKLTARIPGGKALYQFTHRTKELLKRSLLRETMFEYMGFEYLGPVDGHDLPQLIQMLRAARDMGKPVLVHVLTHKGHGYAPAEADPSRFHGIGKFDPTDGHSLGQSKPSFSDAFGQTLTELAREDGRICAITAAMPGGTGLLPFKAAHPDRLYDVGIAEEHAVSLAGGLAKQGAKPVVAIYSTFFQRSYDQIMQDIALLKLPVVLAVDRAGLVGEDGATHHGVFDMGFLRQVPGMTVLCPASCAELSEMLRWALTARTGPVALRYPRGGDGLVTASAWDENTPVVTHRSGKDGAIVTYGTLVNQALEAAELLAKQGIDVSVIRLTRVNPIPEGALEAALTGHKHILIAEEATAGMAESLAWTLHRIDPDCAIAVADLGRDFVSHGAIAQLYKEHGLDGQSLADRFLEVYHHEK